MKASFSDLALYAACPLKYRYLRVEQRGEPSTPPDWRRAPSRLQPTVASEVDRELGLAVHAALRHWQRGVDGGAAATGPGLVAAVRDEAARRGLDLSRADRQMSELEVGLAAYAGGPWPRRHTLFLEQPVRHTLRGEDGFELELRLRVDRVVRYQRHVAILDFKTVTPHEVELRDDWWQLRTYAMAAPELLGIESTQIQLFVIDLRGAGEVPVGAGAAELSAARTELLGAARQIDAGNFAVAGHPQRPCWSCGFRLACPESLARDEVASDR